MRSGTLYAKKLKKAWSMMRKGSKDRPLPDSVDPIEQLMLAVLSEETTLDKARKAHKKLMERMIDYNELRVSGAAEVSETIAGIIPKSVHRGKVLIRLLNAIYQREYTVSLDGLSGKGIRETKHYLDTLEGSSPYVSASVLLWSLGGHAIPVNSLAFEWLQQQELVHPSASHAEVQSFLERHISAADAKEFSLDLESAAGRSGRARSDGNVRSRNTSRGKKTAGRHSATSRPKRGAARSKRGRATKKPSSTSRKTKRAKK